MAEKTFAGKTVEVTEEGYLVNKEDWSKEVAADMAKEDGIELTDKHYEVLEYLRKEEEGTDFVRCLVEEDEEREAKPQTWSSVRFLFAAVSVAPPRRL